MLKTLIHNNIHVIMNIDLIPPIGSGLFGQQAGDPAHFHLEGKERKGKLKLRVSEGCWCPKTLQEVDDLVQGYVNTLWDLLPQLSVSNQKRWIHMRRCFDLQATDAMTASEATAKWHEVDREVRHYGFDRSRQALLERINAANDLAMTILCNLRLISKSREIFGFLGEPDDIREICWQSIPSNVVSTLGLEGKTLSVDPKWDEESNWLRAIEHSLRLCSDYTIEDREVLIAGINEWLVDDDAGDHKVLYLKLAKALYDSGAFYKKDAVKAFRCVFDGWWEQLKPRPKPSLPPPMSLDGIAPLSSVIIESSPARLKRAS